MPKNKCLFQAKSLGDPRYSQWLKKKSDEVALCSYCKKEVNIGNMGRTALTSHLQGKKHQEISKFSCTNPITTLLKKPSETENKSLDNMPQTSKKQVGIDNLMVSNATTKAEIRWVLNMVCSRYSKNSSSKMSTDYLRQCSQIVQLPRTFNVVLLKRVTSQPMVLLPTSIVYCYKRSLLHHIK